MLHASFLSVYVFQPPAGRFFEKKLRKKLSDCCETFTSFRGENLTTGINFGEANPQPY